MNITILLDQIVREVVGEESAAASTQHVVIFPSRYILMLQIDLLAIGYVFQKLKHYALIIGC